MIIFNKKLYVFIIPLAVSYTSMVRALPVDVIQSQHIKEAVLLDDLDEVRSWWGC
jgi:hypothetical protein